MKKPISPRAHGILDYTTALATAVAPRVFGFSHPAARAARAFARGYGMLSAVTDYPAGIKRAVPFRAHGAVDTALGIALPALPWLLGFALDRRARNFFLGLAAVSVAVTVMTQWRDAAAD
jgi:hypothetical protein